MSKIRLSRKCIEYLSPQLTSRRVYIRDWNTKLALRVEKLIRWRNVKGHHETNEKNGTNSRIAMNDDAIVSKPKRDVHRSIRYGNKQCTHRYTTWWSFWFEGQKSAARRQHISTLQYFKRTCCTVFHTTVVFQLIQNSMITHANLSLLLN